jgi:hypothetical protein
MSITLKIQVEHEVGDIVYLKTDTDQKPRQVYAYEVYPGREVIYKIISGTYTSPHYDFELTKEKDVLLSTTN